MEEDGGGRGCLLLGAGESDGRLASWGVRLCGDMISFRCWGVGVSVGLVLWAGDGGRTVCLR